MKSLNSFIIENMEISKNSINEAASKATKAKTFLGIKPNQYIYEIDKKYNVKEIKVVEIKDKQKIGGRYWELLVLEDGTELFVQANCSFWWKDEDPNSFIVYCVTPDIKNDNRFHFVNFWFKSN